VRITVDTCALDLAGVPDIDLLVPRRVELDTIRAVQLRIAIDDTDPDPDRATYFPYATIACTTGDHWHVPADQHVWCDAAEHHLTRLGELLSPHDEVTVTRLPPTFVSTYRQHRRGHLADDVPRPRHSTP